MGAYGRGPYGAGPYGRGAYLEDFDQLVRSGAPFYPWPEMGAPLVTTTIHESVTRTHLPLYAYPSTDVEQENTVGEVIVYAQLS